MTPMRIVPCLTLPECDDVVILVGGHGRVHLPFDGDQIKAGRIGVRNLLLYVIRVTTTMLIGLDVTILPLHGEVIAFDQVTKQRPRGFVNMHKK